MRILLKRVFSQSSKKSSAPNDISDTLKKFENKLTELRNLEMFKKLDTAASSINVQNEKIYQDFSRTVNDVIQKCSDSEVVNKTIKAVDSAKKSIRPHVEYIKQTEIYKDTTASAGKVEKQLQSYLDFYDYGGVANKDYRNSLKSLQESKRVPENKEARSVVVSKPGSFSGINLGFFARGLPSLGLPKSRNVFSHFASELVNALSDKLHGLFGESETARAIKEIRIRDPSFSISSFLKYSQGYLIPEFIESFLNARLEQLRGVCTDSLLIVLGRNFEHDLTTSKSPRPSFAIADIRNCEFKGANVTDDVPCVLVSCSVQQISKSPTPKPNISTSNMFYIFSFRLDTANGSAWRVSEYYSRGMD